MSVETERDVTRARRQRGAPELAPRWRAEVDDYVVDARWSRDGALVALACGEGQVVLLDGATGELRHRLGGHARGALAVAWSTPADGRSEGALPHGVLATAGQDGYARLWNPVTGDCLAELDAAGVAPPVVGGAARHFVPWVEHLAWSPEGDRLATAAGRQVRLWDTAGRLVRRHPAFGATVSALAWRSRPGDSAGARLTAAGYGGAEIYAAEGGAAGVLSVPAVDADGVAIVERHLAWRGSFLTMAWSPDGRVLAAGMQESAIHIWVTLTATEAAERRAAGQTPIPTPRAPGLPPNDGEAAFDNLEMSGYPTKVRELAWSGDGRLLATGGGVSLTVWSFEGKGPANTRPLQMGGPSAGHVLPVSDVAFHPSALVLASGGEDGQLLLWNLVRSTKKPVAGALLPGAVTRVAWHPRDRTVLGAHASGAVAAWEAPR